MDKKLLQLYVVTDRQWLKEGETLSEVVERAISGGATMIQLREKNMNEDDFIQEALEIKKVTDTYGVPLIINDNLRVCQACDAAGVHVGQEDLSAAKAREVLGPDKIVGVTAKTVAQARQAVDQGADYLGSGAMFGSSTKSEARPMTMEQFAEIRQAVDIPIVLIGGIDASNIEALRGSGAQGAAVVSGIFAQADITAAARKLKQLSMEVFPSGEKLKFQTVLFDLDGTLLPMDQEEFVRDYFGRLAKKMAAFGYDPADLPASLWKGVAAMVKNDGSVRNEQVFWDVFKNIYGEKVEQDKVLFDSFYANEFQETANVCGWNPKAKICVEKLKAMGCRVALATNPIFPAVATESRIRWAGFEPSDFEYYTTYENSSFSKPNPDYYKEVLLHMGVRPEECLMVGNDVAEDMAAEKLGMKVFLLTDCMICKDDADISAYPQGDFDDLLRYVIMSQKDS